MMCFGMVLPLLTHLQPVGHDDDRGISDGAEQLLGRPLLFFPVVFLLHLQEAKRGRQYKEHQFTQLCILIFHTRFRTELQLAGNYTTRITLPCVAWYFLTAHRVICCILFLP